MSQAFHLENLRARQSLRMLHYRVIGLLELKDRGNNWRLDTVAHLGNLQFVLFSTFLQLENEEG